MSAILTAITSLVTSAISWTTSYLSLITSNDVLLLMCICVPLVGLGIGVIKRLTRIRA